jgi:acyl carrier protein
MENINITATCEKIIEVICKVTESPHLKNSVNKNSNIINDIGIDSLQMIAFMLHLEEAFDIEINFEVLNISDLKTIENLAKFIMEIKNK